MDKVFDLYSQYYDLIYNEKDYELESEYINTHICKNIKECKTILELGCGTGTHAEYFARMGYKVHGIDMSKSMLERAESKKNMLSNDIASKLSYAHGDVRNYQSNEKYDVVVSLFHVLSYQITNADISSFFKTAAKHLKPGGVFLFDFWYGPAVLFRQPETRIKRLNNDKVNITRLAEPVMHINENIVDVNYDIFIEERSSGKFTKLQEKHKMRYIFLPELEQLLRSESWSDYYVYNWLGNDELNNSDWSAFVVALRK